MNKVLEVVRNIHNKYNNIGSALTELIKKFYKKYKYLLYSFLALILIYLLAYFSIFRADFKFIDDLGRAFSGYQGWDNFNRYISNFLSSFIHTSPYLTDVSPLTQFIAIIFLALSGIIILYLFKKDKITITSVLAVSVIGLCPYFLECISYKYDSPYMALSILASIFPFIFFNVKKKYNLSFIIFIFIGTLIMCMTYQASSGIIPIMTLFLSFRYWNERDNQSAIKILLTAFLGYLCGLLVFKCFLMIPVDGYVTNSMFPLDELIPGAINNLKKYYNYVITDFRNIWLILFLIISICFIARQIINSKRNKICAFIFTLILIAVSLLLAFGVYPLLEVPLFRGRAMYGIGIPITLIMLNSVNGTGKYISKLFVIGLCYCFFAFSFTYGNTLSEQKRYVDFRVQNVINGLNDLKIMNSSNTKTVKLVGTVGKSPVIAKMPKNYETILSRLVSQSFGGTSIWNEYYFKNYFKLKNVKVDYTADIPKDKFKIEKDTMYYKIESNGKDFIIITLK